MIHEHSQGIIELGNINIKCLIFKINSNDILEIQSTSITQSEGIHNGVIVNISKATNAIRSCISVAEKKAKSSLKKINVVLEQPEFLCTKFSKHKKIDGSKIHKDDIEFLLKEAKKQVMLNDEKQSIIHIFNHNYIVDGKPFIEEPIDVYADSLTHELTFITTPKNNLKNINQVFIDCDIGIERLISRTFALGVKLLNEKELEFGANLDISKDAAARISGHYNKREEGDDFSTVTNEHYGEAERWGLRAQFLYQPTDKMDFLFKTHAGSMEIELPLLQTLGVYANIGDATEFGYENVSLGLLTGLLGAGPAGLCNSILSGQGTNQQSCATLTGITPENYGLSDSKYASASHSVLPYLDNSWSGLSLIGNVDLNGITLTSITAYDTVEYNRTQDSDATSVIYLDGDYYTDINFWSQEFRLTSAPDNTFNWILGASYSEDTLTESSGLYGSEGIMPLLFEGAINTKQSYKQKSDGYSVYGHSTYALTNALELITELRYTKENKSFIGDTTFGFGPGLDVPLVTVDDSTSFSALSGKLGVTYSASDNLMFYGNVSKGFKTGGFFGGFVTSVEQLAPYDEETIWAYEVGFKSDLLDNQLRINGSIFKYDRQDVQANAADPTAVVSIARLTNIGEVDTTGAELEFGWLATEDLFIELNLGYTDAYVSKTNFESATAVPLLGSASVEGVNLPNYSKFSANLLARYEHGISEQFSGAVQLEYSYRSDHDLSMILKPEYETPILNEPGVGITNLRYVLNNTNDWKIMASIENITDEIHRVETTNNGFFGMH